MKLFDFILENNNKNINIYCDMDGVIAEYDIGNFNYETIRPLKTSINNIKKLFCKENINIYILSICKTDKIIEDKIIWLNKYMPFLKKDNMILLSKENNLYKDLESKDIKLNYLKKNISKSDVNIVIDDDINIIKNIKTEENINIYHVSSLID